MYKKIAVVCGAWCVLATVGYSGEWLIPAGRQATKAAQTAGQSAAQISSKLTRATVPAGLQFVRGVSVRQAKIANLRTPSGVQKPYFIVNGQVYSALPQISDAVRASYEIQTLKKEMAKGLVEPQVATVQMAEKVILDHAQISSEDLRYATNFIHLQLARNASWPYEIYNEEYAWVNAMTNLTVLSFLKQDAQIESLTNVASLYRDLNLKFDERRLSLIYKVMEMVKFAPKEYRYITDFITVRALFNLRAYNEIADLAAFRASQEKWVDENGLFRYNDTSLMVFMEAAFYARQAGIEINWPEPVYALPNPYSFVLDEKLKPQIDALKEHSKIFDTMFEPDLEKFAKLKKEMPRLEK